MNPKTTSTLFLLIILISGFQACRKKEKTIPNNPEKEIIIRGRLINDLTQMGIPNEKIVIREVKQVSCFCKMSPDENRNIDSVKTDADGNFGFGTVKLTEASNTEFRIICPSGEDWNVASNLKGTGKIFLNKPDQVFNISYAPNAKTLRFELSPNATLDYTDFLECEVISDYHERKSLHKILGQKFIFDHNSEKSFTHLFSPAGNYKLIIQKKKKGVVTQYTDSFYVAEGASKIYEMTF